MKNSDCRYGSVSKFLHWTVFFLILNQFIAAAAMMNTPDGETTAGFTQGGLYEWHKSIGLVVLMLAIVRVIWRRTTPLPDWAPNLGDGEKRAIEWTERLLYLCMFLMPLSGFIFVMAGNYGVKFFGRWPLPNIVGAHDGLASVAEWSHWSGVWLLVAALLMHWGIAIRHQWIHRDRYVHRMLPFTHQR
jgi:cytochrome b561